MLRRVKRYIEDNQLLNPGQKVLVGVSGGADSVALLDVLLRAGYQCHVAHCNFHLRGEESMRDEEHVRALCHDLPQRLPSVPDWAKEGLPLYTRDFETLAYARTTHRSVELSARELRYQWWDELTRQLGINTIAVAHHQNDQAETIIMNIRRGCGLKGLCGMWPKAHNPYASDEDSAMVVRPLLCTTHDYICHYLRDIRHIEWVEDSTNNDTRYRRNAVREELSSWTKAEVEHACEMAERMRTFKFKV